MRTIPILRTAALTPLLAALVCAQDLTVFRTPEMSPQTQLTRYLNNIALSQLRERTREISGIRRNEDMEQRKKVVREKLLRLMGGLPSYRGPLNVKQVGALDRGDYRIEKVVYESLPKFYVTANVYVPASGGGPFPAILMPVGHYQGGKDGERETAISLARKGFVVLKYDPLGQGERLQYYDPDLRASKVGGTVEEHSQANGHAMLIGDNVARYRVWDAMRGIDYLVSRRDVDPNRIGCTGCSGGGTITTYVSALDERVKVAAPSCYITSWEEIMAKPGPQDAEQSLPNFLKEHLNIADYVELFAPKPWLSLSTIEDFFPLEGARQTFEEAKRIYALYGAQDNIGWYIGPGGHGVPQPSREALYAWFIKHLKNGGGDSAERPVQLDPPENLLCTKTGQVSDSLGGETVFSLNKSRAAEVMPHKEPVSSEAEAASLRSRLAEAVRGVAMVSMLPGGPPPAVRVQRSEYREGYRMDLVSLSPEKNIQLPGLLMIPDGPGAKPAVLAADTRPKEVSAAAGGEMEALVRAGHIVFIVQPRGLPEAAERGQKTVTRDQVEEPRAEVVGKTLAGMRTDDIIRAVDYLVSRADVDPARITGFGQGPAGVPMLYAAVLDTRISQLKLQETLAAFRLAVDGPLYRNLYEIASPGVLRNYDLDELLVALSPRPVTIVRPVDALGRILNQNEFREICRYAFEAGERMRQRERIRFVEPARSRSR